MVEDILDGNDMNDHIERSKEEFKGIMGSYSYDDRNISESVNFIQHPRTKDVQYLFKEDRKKIVNKNDKFSIEAHPYIYCQNLLHNNYRI